MRLPIICWRRDAIVDVHSRQPIWVTPWQFRTFLDDDPLLLERGRPQHDSQRQEGSRLVYDPMPSTIGPRRSPMRSAAVVARLLRCCWRAARKFARTSARMLGIAVGRNRLDLVQMLLGARGRRRSTSVRGPRSRIAHWRSWQLLTVMTSMPAAPAGRRWWLRAGGTKESTPSGYRRCLNLGRM